MDKPRKYQARIECGFGCTHELSDRAYESLIAGDSDMHLPCGHPTKAHGWNATIIAKHKLASKDWKIGHGSSVPGDLG